VLEKYREACLVYEKMLRLNPEIRWVKERLYPEWLRRLENSMSGNPNTITP